ncbi:MAG: TIGR03618 family F420-dependent PPOX class oxidoreductase [Candidatus Hydrogenedentota bacterium]
MKLDGLARRLVTEGKNFAALGTTMADGSSHTGIVWIDADGDRIFFNTELKRIKAKNMKRDPRVSMAVWNAENPYQQAMIRGRVVEMKTEGAEEVIDRLAKKYMGLEKFPYNQPGDVRVTVFVEPDHIMTVG